MRITGAIKPVISYLLLFLNMVVSLSLILSSVASAISPSVSWIPALFGLAFPFLFLLNLFFLLMWSLNRNKKFLVPLLACLMALPTAFNFFAFNPEKKESAAETYKVLSFNVRNFDLYNWSSNKQTRNRIFDFLKREQADIICLQEFFNSTSEKDDFITLDTILQFQPARNFHAEYTSTLYRTQNWGIATFSTYPIVNRKKLEFDRESNNICIYTDIKINEDTLRVYNMHLASIHFKQSDYRFIDSISMKNNQEQISGSLSVLRKLKRAFVKRAGQTEKILESIRQSPYPVLICGDFNDTPSSYTYSRLTSLLRDAFMESGNGVGRTYIGSFPSFRIDYILHSTNLQSADFQTYKDVLSDHYPVGCLVYFPAR